MRKIKLVTGEYYHIYNRGVEKRQIFMENSDFYRFLLGLKEFNSMDDTFNLKRVELFGAELRTEDKNSDLVAIICYCFMPNHFHFILRQLQDGGIPRFMHKLGTGYTNYFNLKYKHSGVLFQGAYKAKHIESDSYILNLSRYIHQNPYELFQSNLAKRDLNILVEKYKWSSLQFYLNNRPCLLKLDKDIILKQFQDKAGYRRFICSEPSSEQGFELERMC